MGEPVSAGKRIGPYQVVRELGRGGMGAVYLAERADGQFEQQVALKLIKRGMDSEALLHRFLHERQILARLQHARVARLLDGGISQDGQPYFAMEYVPGVPLTVYCDTRQLDVEARLRLFEQVCRAVHYAHTNLVVHRDLKPSNMLVTEDGDLKLLDFGIARLLDDEAGTGTTRPAEAGLRAMTPEYAAPKQVRGEAVTTATDIYALAIRVQAFPEGHWRRAETQNALGACLSALGRFDEAERLLLDGYDALKASEGVRHPTTRRAAHYLATHYERRGLPEQAAAYQRAAMGH